MSTRTEPARDGAGHSPYVQPDLGGVVSRLSMHVRRRMFGALLRLATPTPATRVLDVGVTSDRRADSNFFEKLYPYPHRVTALGLENAEFLRVERPGLTLVRGEGLHLPFRDGAFDLVVCFAVIEHVGSRGRQRALVRELCRVGRACCVTTPNRWHPLEFHTVLPLIHWLPPARWRGILRRMGREFWADEGNLNPLSERDVLGMFPDDVRVVAKRFRLLGPVSNLLLYASRRSGPEA